jgi:uncharacterized membrane protein
MLSAGRIVFSIAIVGFGVVCLMHVDFIHQLQPVPLWMPGYRLLAVLNAMALIAGGLAILAKYKVHEATIGLAVLLAAGTVVLQPPGAFADPSLLRSPWWIRTFEAVALAGSALVLAGVASRPPRANCARLGRILFGVSLPVFGILHLYYAEGTATLVPAWYPVPLFWAMFTGVAHFAAGVSITEEGPLARLAATLIGVMFAAFVLTLHLPSQLEYANARAEQTSLFVAIGMCGAAWIVAGSLGTQEGEVP